MQLKYTTPEAVQAFVQDMDKFSTGEMLQDPHVTAFIEGRAIQISNKLKIAESFLVMFEQREDYELCAKLTKTYPELINR